MPQDNLPPELCTETRTSELTDLFGDARPQALGLIVLAHPDPSRVGDVATLPGLAAGDAEPLSRQRPVFAPPGRSGPFRPLAESHLSRKPWVFQTSGTDGQVVLQPAGSRTRLDIDGQPVDGPRHFSREEIEDGVVMVLSQRVALLLTTVNPLPSSRPRFGLVGDARTLEPVRQGIQTASDLDVPVLLRGETGTGKELVAQALHHAGRRRQGPFIAVNMGTLAPSLAAAELFGSAKGAYTGADRKRLGLFRSADGGTLFLDEIGDAPAEVQVMLLRVLEDQKIQPVGSAESHAVDVRIVAATDARLEQAIADGSFRAPLLHRLAGLRIDLPPLRRRREDIPRLLAHFAALERETLGVASSASQALPAHLIARLVAYHWPGNVRQLRNLARQYVVAQHGGTLDDFVKDLDRLPDPPLPNAAAAVDVAPSSAGPPAPAPAAKRRWFRKRTDVGEDELLATLRRHDWQLRPTAEALGVSRATLYRLIDACPGIRKAADLERGEIEDALATFGDLDAAAAHLQVSPQGLKRRWKDLS